MTRGVAPSASIACTLRMDTEPTNLSEFSDDEPEVSPEQNAADIQQLLELVETLTEHVGEIRTELDEEHHHDDDGVSPQGPADYEPASPKQATERMYQ